MRMWNTDPETMCNQHLLGEHVEMHMFDGSIRKGISMHGYLRGRLVDLGHIQSRHDELAAEMTARGANHKTPLVQPYISKDKYPNPISVLSHSLSELYSRCADCKDLLDAKLTTLVKEPQPDRMHMCPVCKGYGGADPRWNKDTKRWYHFLICRQCNGYGWLRLPPACIHEFQDSFDHGELVITCKMCGYQERHDTSG